MSRETYALRDYELQRLGFASYYEYLASDLWFAIRLVVYERDRYRCKLPTCTGKSKKVQVHHLSYSRETLLGIDPGSLVTLCIDCHKVVEFNGKQKLSLDDSRKKAVRLLLKLKKRVSRLKVAIFLRNRMKENQPIARRILTRLRRDCPEYSKVIEADVQAGKLNRSFKTYLGL